MPDRPKVITLQNLQRFKEDYDQQANATYYKKAQGEAFEEEVDERVSHVESELSNVASGSPKGVYATLSDLEAAYPTGTTGIFVVTATGHWYFWNGSAWTDGGTYQSTETANYSLEWYKTKFVKRGINLFNKNTALDGYYIGYSSGGAFDNASFVASDYIPIDATQGYVTVRPYNSYQMAFYDETKTYISGAYYGNTTNGVAAIPNNAKYVRFSVELSQKNVCQLEYGQTAHDYEAFYLEFTEPKPFIIPAGFVEWFQTNFATRGKNLFNKATAFDDYYIAYVNGTQNSNSSFFASDYIPIDSSKGYLTLNQIPQYQLAFYDSNKQYISGEYTGSSATGIVAIPAAARYVRFSTYKYLKNAAQLEYGQEVTEFENYYNDFIAAKDAALITKEVNEENAIKVRKNLFDYTGITPDKYWGSAAGLNSGSSCCVITNPILLKPNTRYTVYPKNRLYKEWCWLARGPKSPDTQSNITNFGYTDDNGTFTTDDTHVYLHATLDGSTQNSDLKLIEGDTPNTGLPFGKSIITAASEMAFFVGANRQFTTLKAGVEYASQFPNAKLYVDEGTYDLVSEFGSEVLETTNSVYGLILKNGLHIIFSPKAKVTFNYTGSNSYIHTDFSPFNTGLYGGTLENLDLECSNCRYGIHDERGTSTDRYVNRFINCRIKVDNSQNPDWSNPQNIGGGLGSDGYIEIIGCVFNHAVTYHNNHYEHSSAANSKSTVIIKDCYFENYGIQINGYNSYVIPKSRFVVTNNSLKVLEFNDDIPNVELFAWNNEVRAN